MLKAMTTTALVAAVLVLASVPAGAQPAPREIKWEELVPKGWDPTKAFQAKGSANLRDGTVQALEQMRELRRVWDDAPTNPALDGQVVKLPGYVVPLETTAAGWKEFLLVPYFGACIHSPPPPANQIVHVVSARPVKGFSAMDTVWVSGTMGLSRQDSGMGVSGYRLAAGSVTRYVAPGR